MTRPTRTLQPMTPVQQLRAGRLPRRITQLMVGLTLYGVSMSMIIRAALGLDPWDVFHVGVALHLPMSIGVTVIVVGVAVLLAWIPLRQWPGLGTVANAVWIGVATDWTLSWLVAPSSLWVRAVLLVAGIVLNGLAGALYIGAQLGPGPRDGLMTGIAHRTGLSLRLVRTSLEVTVLAVGWLLGGGVGLGTVLYAVGIGPIVQHLLPWCIVPVTAPTTPLADWSLPDGVARREVTSRRGWEG
ncbi:YitT family protein [Arsenicicoccus cauae]|uniref:membrane protein YczE n=1 Tax=Arsenicicoccus cauae TaxID=2663847 RepID=UPI00370DE25D